MTTSPFDQSRYHVRLEWGLDGLARVTPADVVVVVDVLRYSTTVTDAVARGDFGPRFLSSSKGDSGLAGSVNGAPIVAAAAASDSLVLLGSLRNAAAVARAVLAEQERRGARTSVAVIAAGERSGDAVRFAVEDQLGAGAVIDALAGLGIDHTSPEAAVAGEAFRGLRGAVRHLLTASGSGQELIARDLRDDVLNAAEIDATDAVPVLRDGTFERF